MKFILFAIACVIMISGCALAPTKLCKSGMTQYEFDSDLRDCQYEVRLHQGNPFAGRQDMWLVNIADQKELAMMCMQRKGYYVCQ